MGEILSPIGGRTHDPTPARVLSCITKMLIAVWITMNVTIAVERNHHTNDVENVAS